MHAFCHACVEHLLKGSAWGYHASLVLTAAYHQMLSWFTIPTKMSSIQAEKNIKEMTENLVVLQWPKASISKWNNTTM